MDKRIFRRKFFLLDTHDEDDDKIIMFSSYFGIHFDSGGDFSYSELKKKKVSKRCAVQNMKLNLIL